MRKSLKRAAIWGSGGIAALATTILIAFMVSPWPTVMVINMMFSKGEKVSEAGLEAHVPPGIVTHIDLQYGEQADERFDLNYAQDTITPQPTIVWIHGGGWIAGQKSGVANYMKVLAGKGFTAVAIEYSTGWNGTYPKPVDQVNAALGYLVANAEKLKIDPKRLILAGDSAGAQIAAQVALVTTDPGYASKLGIRPMLPADGIASLVLVSGAFNLDEMRFEGDYAWFTKAVMWAYSGDRKFLENERFRMMSVSNYVGAGFPPSFITSGNGDPLEKQARTLTARIEAAGVKVDTLFFDQGHTPPLPHEYQFNLNIPEGQEALSRMLAFLKPVTSSQIGSEAQ